MPHATAATNVSAIRTMSQTSDVDSIASIACAFHLLRGERFDFAEAAFVEVFEGAFDLVD